MTEKEKEENRKWLKQNPMRTFIKPSADCKSLRVWQTMGSPSKEPSDDQCKALGGDFSPSPGFVHCEDFKIYQDKTATAKASQPSVYVEKDATLVTKNISGSGIGMVNSKYKLVNGKIQFTSKFGVANATSAVLPTAKTLEKLQQGQAALPTAEVLEELQQGVSAE